MIYIYTGETLNDRENDTGRHIHDQQRIPYSGVKLLIRTYTVSRNPCLIFIQIPSAALIRLYLKIGFRMTVLEW